MHRAAMFLAVATMAGGVLGGCGEQSAGGGATSTTSAVPATPATSSAQSSVAAPTTPAGPTTRTINITVRDGQISGDTGRVEVPLGTPVTLTVTSDLADEIHVHGYDQEAPIPAGGTGSVSFVADIPGVFEVELHESGLSLLQLQVS